MSIPRTQVNTWRRSLDCSIIIVSIALLGLACRSEQNGEGGIRTPSASFTQSQMTGSPGTAIQFTDTSGGTVTRHSWDFGALGLSTEQHPLITFSEVGTYSVALTVSGPRGTSRVMQSGLIRIGEPPVVGFSCFTTLGFVPLTVSCADSSADADNVLWDFGDGSTSEERTVQHVFESVGSYTVELTASGAGGVDSTSITVEVLPFGIISNPVSGSAPVDASFTAVTGGLGGLIAWVIDGQIQFGGTILQHRFNNPGTFSVSLLFGDPTSGVSGEHVIEYVVDYGPASAAFMPSVSDGNGPLEVILMDDSVGAIDKWEWDFGDGAQCVFPAPSMPDPIPVCDASSPRHVYERVGFYDVTLEVTGPGADTSDPSITSTTTTIEAVRVYIADPSFEIQIANAQIGGAWTHLRPTDSLENALHITLGSGQSDSSLPTEGTQWAVLDGKGTDGSTSVGAIENGIRQDFFRPMDRPVLEFDYALLYSEPPASPALDAIAATVSDGTTTIEIPGARADVSSPYLGLSTIYPDRDGSDVRITPTRTASINLATAFPAATERTRLTLTIRTSNAVNEFRSPRAYVDNIRFTEPADELSAEFVLDTDPVVVGQDAVFADETCLDPSAGTCSVPTSWRWDFDTQLLASPPSASGSEEQNPSYAFPEAGNYDVRMLAVLADLESEFSLVVTVLDRLVASFSIDPVGPYPSAPATLTFGDTSTSDTITGDPITDWSWDFGGWGTSTLQNPAPVTIGQSGNWIITLMVTTASGQTDSVQTIVTVQ